MQANQAAGIILAGAVHAFHAADAEAPAGAVVPATRINITNKQTDAQRGFVTGNDRNYSAAALLPGVYEVAAEAPGFQQLVREAIVDVGAVTATDIIMRHRTATEKITVTAVSPQVRYDRELRDVLALHDEAPRAIANQVQIKLSSQDEAKLASGRPVGPEALESYLKGRYEGNKRTKEGLKKSIKYLEQTIQKDPNYVHAWARVVGSLRPLGRSWWAVMSP